MYTQHWSSWLISLSKISHEKSTTGKWKLDGKQFYSFTMLLQDLILIFPLLK